MTIQLNGVTITGGVTIGDMTAPIIGAYPWQRTDAIWTDTNPIWGTQPVIWQRTDAIWTDPSLIWQTT